jgi:cobalt/nickel transport system ATP-binding protein
MADGPTLEIFQNTDLLVTCHLEKPLRMQPCPVLPPKTQ